ncbi:MAG: hypothetical protein ACRDHM_11130 [Actinomycetota bacterium]
MKRPIKTSIVAAAVLAGMLPILPASAELKENINRVGGVGGSSGGHIAFEGNRLYMGTYGTGMRWFDISDPKNPKLLGTYEPGTTISPRADAVPDAAVFDGRHIAILNGTGRSNFSPIASLNTQKTEFLDVTDPAKPVLLHTFTAPSSPNDAEAHNGDIFDAERLWLPSGGGSGGTMRDTGLRIYDLQPLLDNPADPSGVDNPANNPKRIFPSDSCWTDAAVLCDPVTLWRDSPYRGDKPVGPEPFTHTHDITIYPDHPVAQADGSTQLRDIILLAEGGNYQSPGLGSVFVIDITDPSNPVVLYRWLHQTGTGHHPIRYHHEAIFIEGKPNLMIVADEDLHNGCGTAGGLTAVQLTPDLLSGTETSEWFIPAGTPAAVCSSHVFSTAGNLLFMGAYNAGTQVVDYSDPAKPKRAGFYIGDGSTAWGAYYNPDNGFIYQGDVSRGLDVLQFLAPIPGLPTGGGGTVSPPIRTCPGRASSPLAQLVGTEQKDVLRGGSGNEIICGLGKKDTIKGGGGRDIIIAGGGNDRVNGGAGNDKIVGGGGNDRLRGGSGRDRCIGSKGRDRGSKCEKGKL